MKRDYIDFHAVPERQLAVHDVLLNWARSMNGPASSGEAAMWRNATSSEVWSLSSTVDPVDQAAARRANGFVCKLPEKHLKSLQWHYVMRSSIISGQRYVACTAPELAAFVIDARDMLRNRGLCG